MSSSFAAHQTGFWTCTHLLCWIEILQHGPAEAVAVSFPFANAFMNRFHEGPSVGSSTTIAIILQAGEGMGVDGLM